MAEPNAEALRAAAEALRAAAEALQRQAGGAPPPPPPLDDQTNLLEQFVEDEVASLTQASLLVQALMWSHWVTARVLPFVAVGIFGLPASDYGAEDGAFQTLIWYELLVCLLLSTVFNLLHGPLMWAHGLVIGGLRGVRRRCWRRCLVRRVRGDVWAAQSSYGLAVVDATRAALPREAVEQAARRVLALRRE